MKNLALCLLLLISPSALRAAAAARPNILYILADDLGYGDVQALNPERGKIKTPHLDKLAAQGMAFTDAHSGSSVCTPTRYGLLTGRYAWRTRLQNGVLDGASKPLIAADRLTVAALLKQHGYFTAAVGKWHLGMNLPPAQKLAEPITEGPLARGFDYFFGISASLDMPPFAFIENDRYTEAPTAQKQWLRKGAAAPGFEAVDVLPALSRKTVEIIGQRAADARAGKPFFIYLPLTSPHTPILPTSEWQGKSGLGAYGDFVMQTDAAVGEIFGALEKTGLAESTLVIFTSDNGCSPAAGTGNLEKQGHFASGQFRGFKADIWEGGHRVPFLVRWPGKVKAGSQNTRLICHTDLMATCADVVGAKLPDNAGEDSVSFLPALLGTDKPAPRDAVVHHSIQGKFAIRRGQWKLALCAGSGGWSKGGGPESPQLYDFDADPGETKNLAAEKPGIVAELTALMEKFVTEGRSTPGPKQANDVPVVFPGARPQPGKAPPAAADKTASPAQVTGPLPAPAAAETSGGWRKFAGNPVMGGKYGTCFDISVLREGDTWRMYLSWRPKKSLAMVESKDGIHWSEPPRIVFGPRAETGWEDEINRPCVLKKGDTYHLWYTGQTKTRSWIGYATSMDGVNWKRMSDKPVLTADQPWELNLAVMCPSVLWDEATRLFRMWYSGGEQGEPNAIGYATSPDGLVWTKHAANPVFTAEPKSPWEKHKVTGCQVEKVGDWHVMFYIGFQDEATARICLARSKDGITNWQRHPANPVISPGKNKWDHLACYKPYAIFDGGKWLLWYNGRQDSLEQIGVALHEGKDLGFEK